MPNATAFPPFWEGFSVVSIDSETETLQIELRPDPRRVPRCGGCQQPCPAVHEYCTRRIRDLPILGRPVRLRVHLRRLACSGCGRRAEWVSW
ncbi:transposase family protein, partial [Metapseudomonas resinovorans]|uniref:transposase family protein n=1 Tax=Metapseudomonas resinovorans TaxID=53412 RepID=UPI00332834E8